jgi:hypothetical protein
MLSVQQSAELNACWKSVNRIIFGFNRWDSVKSFNSLISGMGRLDFYHIVSSGKLKFYSKLHCSECLTFWFFFIDNCTVDANLDCSF